MKQMKEENPYEHLAALYMALVRAWDQHITPIDKNVKCWKVVKDEKDFLLGMTISEKHFDGRPVTESNFGYTLPMKYWDECRVMEYKEIPEGAPLNPLEYIRML